MLKQIHDRVLESQLQVRLQLHAQFSIGTFADADFYGVIFRPNRISSRFFNRRICPKEILPPLKHNFRKITAFDQVHAFYAGRII